MGLALAVSVLAGLATSIGGVLALHPALRHRTVLGVALAFAAGAMLAISVVAIVPQAYRDLTAAFGAVPTVAMLTGALLAGGGLVLLIDRVVPHSLNPADIAGGEEELSWEDRQHNVRLLRSGVLVAAVVALHNLPEGMSTFLGTLEDPALGISMGVAVAIHNIPEGIAVAAPVYAATGRRSTALGWATFSGLAEPLGALAGFAVLRVVVPAELFSLTFGLVAGMMVMVALRELLPAAQRYRTGPVRMALSGGVGAGVMLLSVALLR